MEVSRDDSDSKNIDFRESMELPDVNSRSAGHKRIYVSMKQNVYVIKNTDELLSNTHTVQYIFFNKIRQIVGHSNFML